jgi:hypothetical protein
MKTLEEIERDVEFQLLNNRQTQIIEMGPEFSGKHSKEWDENRKQMESLKKKGCKRRL